MKSVVTLLFFAFVICSQAQNKLGPIGQWRGHYNNQSIQQVVKGGNYIYAASPYQIIRFKNPNQPYWIDKTTGLSDIHISQLAWDETQDQLVIAYANSNIDIMKGDQVYNLNAIQLTNLYASKKINALRIYKRWALVATNFGIVQIDLITREIKDSWFPNNNQQPTATYDLLIAHDSIYATTANGLWVASINTNNLARNQWVRLSQYDNYALQKLCQFQNTIFAHTNNALFKLPFTNPVLQFNNAQISFIDTVAANLNIGIQYLNNKGALLQINKDNTIVTLIDSSLLGSPKQFVGDNSNYWVADSLHGLLLKNNTNNWLNVGGPKAAIQGLGTINENELIAANGISKKGFVKFNELGWTTYVQIGSLPLPNLNAAALQNQDHSYWLSSNNALLQVINENQVNTYQPTNGIGAYQQIQIDQNNKVWAVQDKQGLVQQMNNTWNLIALPNNFNKNGLNQFTLNAQGQAWLIAPNNEGIYVYQDKSKYPNETWKQLTTQASNGNLPSANVTSICNDLNGSIWVGTNNGIGIFNCGDIATEPCNAYLPIVNNNGFNGYLFQKETIRCISVDGANRKWLGTNNGAWLLSSDGLEILEHFTKANSPLPNDTVVQIYIQPNTAEVFINTLDQMVSYRGTATKGAATQSRIQVFPNPISSNFNGQIAIRGLIDNALVKITDINGKLIFQTIALGGQALWNARNYEGKKMATGIYLVFVRDLSGNEKSVGKIVIADGY